MADDIVGLMDKLGTKGHSLGGFIGQNIGLRHPDRFHSLVLYATITHADAWIQRVNRMRLTLLKTAGPRLRPRDAAVPLSELVGERE